LVSEGCMEKCFPETTGLPRTQSLAPLLRRDPRLHLAQDPTSRRRQCQSDWLQEMGPSHRTEELPSKLEKFLCLALLGAFSCERALGDRYPSGVGSWGALRANLTLGTGYPLGIGSQGAASARYPYLLVKGLVFLGQPLFWRTLQTLRGHSVLGRVVWAVESVTDPGCAYHPAVSSN
jgi:hypothetical protein